MHKKPATSPKAMKPWRKHPPQLWWQALLDYLVNFILLLMASALTVGLAGLLQDFFGLSGG